MVLNKRDFSWKNEPSVFSAAPDGIHIETVPNTDLWQRTHYGFRADTGHCLTTKIIGDFTMTLTASFIYKTRFDQCGIVAYLNSNFWVKASIEYGDDLHSALGSVVTNNGYSDWATTDISSSQHTMQYRLHRRGNDFCIEQASPGKCWAQMRVFHLFTDSASVSAGMYACSPSDSSFSAHFFPPEISGCLWEKE